MRQCKICKLEKNIEEFVNWKKQGVTLYLYKCKECKNKARRNGKPPYRAPKGYHPKSEWVKGRKPWNSGIKGIVSPKKDLENSKRFSSLKYKEWKRLVKERDGNKCVKCGSANRVAAHHIVPWKENEVLRFEISNGMSLCSSCHTREEKLGKPSWNKGKKGVMPTPWNKGKKGVMPIPWNKGKKTIK